MIIGWATTSVARRVVGWVSSRLKKHAGTCSLLQHHPVLSWHQAKSITKMPIRLLLTISFIMYSDQLGHMFIVCQLTA